MNKGTTLDITFDAMGTLARFFFGGREVFPSDPLVASEIEGAVRFDGETGEPVILMSALPVYAKHTLTRIREIRGAKLRSNVLSRR